MKKTIIGLLAAIAILGNTAMAKNDDPSSTIKLPRLSTLMVNANVTIVLVNNSNATMHLQGQKKFGKALQISKSGDTLIITGPKYTDLKYAGVIYVSANQLKNITINSDASIRSLTTLRVPRLDVLINGACEFDIHNIGDVVLASGKDYDLEQTKSVREIPAVLYEEKL